ncbi:hypothetical protein BK133_11300 [Paenibacillus sp. FSL H8-0548]|uniref:hypothetical protein n=1 Tax=Paenibacillus sp. FSL H8-0548 TaxID=1920422 RepID=UPI00096F0D06|nr:hypothetical protein [Paenibacillus sp. FSL H8-0548]OMF35282.1 hypothetical protein BK133_11300 [Paenibacillus sp. FSL H8-0548]
MIVRDEIIDDHRVVGIITEDNTWFLAKLSLTAPNGETFHYERTTADRNTALWYIDDTIKALSEVKDAH